MASAFSTTRRIDRLVVDEPAATAECEGGIAPGTDVTEMGTLGGRVCFTNFSYSVGAFAVEDSLTTTVWLAREGMYYQADLGQSAYYPPDFAHVGVSTGVGCFVVDGDVITTEYLGQLKTVSLSFGVGPLSVGWTFYILPGEGVQRAFAYSTGYGASASLFAFPISFGLSVSTDGENIVGPRAVRGWGDECLAPLVKAEGASFATAEYNALSVAADNLEAMAREEPTDYRGLLMQQAAVSTLPLMRMIGRPSGGGVAENIPAGTNADFYDDFLARSGTGLCTDCPNTSLDTILTGFNDQMAQAEEIDEILQTGFASVEQVTASMPQMLMQGSLQLDTAAANDLVFEVAADLAAEARGDENRYVAQDLKIVEVEVGEPAALDVTAEEIANLIGVEESAVEGATVTFDAQPRVEAASFAIEEGVAAASLTPSQATPILFRVEVDLGTAAGPLPEGVEDWVVRPPMRLLKIAAGPPSFAYLSAPGTTVSGSPVGLSAAVLDEDYNLIDAPFTARFYDADGEIAVVDSDLGAAEHRFVPRPSDPVIEAFDPDALELQGRGFSQDAVVEVDGEMIGIAVESSRSIRLDPADLEPGTHTVVVRNPNDVTSEAYEIEL